jgi:hypothetical protein
MAAFTASLFLVSSNLALPAQANDLAQAARGDMSRQEWRQFRQENRNAGLPSRGVPLPVFSTQPITVPVSGAEPINPPPVLHHTAPNLNLSGGLTTVGTRQERREARRENREARREARTGTAVPQPITPKVRETREARTERIQTHQAEKLSRFVIQENAGALIKLDNGANLDLTASSRNITLGDKLFADGGFVTIEVGGEKKNVYAGSKVTAAEYVAVKQVLGGKQSVVVDSNGVATGGTVDLNNLAASRNNMKASGLTVASGVTAVGDLAKDSSFRINGDLNNFGNVYAVASEKGRHAGDINAENITNNAGALISSDAGNKHGNRADAIDLALNADKNFTNFGTIESSGDLNISAGNSIKNSGSTSAKNNVSLNSSDIANSGTVSAKLGNVTLDSPVATVMNVNNEGGKIQALNGSINVRAPGNVDALDSNIAGGDLLSRQLNIQAGQGMADINVKNLTGTVNGAGLSAHVTADTEVLNLGDLCLTGDPIYKNSGGDINFTGNLSATEAIAVLASGNITSTAGSNITITARSGGATGTGQLITFAAGYAVSAGGTNTGSIPPGTVAGANVTANSVGGGGGNIDFSNANSFNIDVNGVGGGIGGNNGGNVNLFALRNGATGGNILLPTTSTINTSASGLSTAGSVNVIGAGNIAVGSITANATLGGSGSVLVRNTNPTGSTTFNSNGTVNSGSFNTAGPTTNGTITINNNANIQARNNVTIDSFSSITGSGTGTHSLSSANNDVSISGTSMTSSGGSFSASANNGTTSVNLGAGGTITTGGGSVNFSAAGDVAVTAASINTTSAAAGGSVTLEADSNDNGAGNLSAGGVSITTSGNGAGNSGGINLDSGDDAGAVLQVGALNSAANGTGTSGGINMGGLSGDGGNITVNGTINAGGATVTIDSSTNNHTFNMTGATITAGAFNINLGTGNATRTGGGLTITTDSYGATVGTFSVGNNPFVIQNRTAGTTIGINGGAGALNISATELADIIASSLTIGSATAGTIDTAGTQSISGTAGTTAGAYNLTLISNSNITGSGNYTLGANSFTATANGSVTLGNITGGTGAAAIDVSANAGNLTLGNLTNANGLIDVDASGTVNVGTITTVAGVVDVDAGGTATVAAITKTGAGAITVDGTSVTVTGATSSNAGGSVTYTNSSGLISTGAITTTTGLIDLGNGTGTTITTGALQTNGGNIDIDAGTAVQIASINALNGGTFTIDAGTDVTLVGAVTGNAASLVVNNTNGTINTVGITTNGAIDLGGAGTTSITVAGALSAGAGAVTLDATGAIGVSGAITTTGSVAANGASVAYATIGGPTASVTLNATGGQVNGGTITSAGAIDLDATTSITTTDLVGLSVDADAASISVGTVTTSAGGSVSLTATAGSVLAGTISAADGLVDVDATTTANLGDVTTTGAVTVDGNTGVTTLNIGGAASSIVLNSTAGAISTGTLTATGLIDVGGNTTTGVTTGAISTGGNVDLDASNASVIQTGTIGAGAGNITVDSGSNNLGVLTNTGTIAVNAATTSSIAGINNAAGSPVFPGPFQVSIVSGNTTNITGPINGGTGNILLQGTTGDVNFTTAALTTGTLVINAGNNTTGTSITTTTGNINITSTNGNTSVTTIAQAGGTMNVTSGGTTNIGSYTNTTGDIIINSANDVTIGTTILTGAGSDIIIHSGANIITTGTLQADPIQMTAVGSISLGGSLIADNGIGLVAGTDIFNTVGGININANGLTNGGAVTAVAGADFSVAGTNVTINGASASGGSILLNNVAGFGNISATGTAGTGGAVTLAAYSNGFAGGQVLLPTTSGIITTGSGANASGAVTVVAGAINGLGVQIGSITQSTATNGAAGAATIVQAATPNAGQVINLSAGYSGSFPTTAYGAADIRTGNITNRAGSVNVSGAGNVGLGTVNVSGRVAEAGGSITILAQGSDVFDIGIAGGNNFALGLQANGGTTSGAGGTINLTNLGSTGIRTQTAFSITTVNGAGGNLILNGDQGNISLANGTYGVNAGTTGSAGNIVLTGAGVLVTGGGSAALQANGAGGGNGGNITITGTGAPGLTFGTGAGQLTVSTTGATNGVVNANVGGNLTVSATGGFTANAIILTTTGAGSDITVNGALTSTLGTVLNSNDAIAINSTVNGGAGVLATAGGTINGSGSANGTQVILNSTGGDIGNSSASRLNVNATDLVAIAQAGSVFLNDTAGGVNLIGATVVPGFGSFGPSSAANTFDLVATGGALSNSAAGSVTASDVVLRSTNSTVTLNGVVTGTNSASIRGTGMTTAGVGLVSGGTVTLTADTGDVGTSTASRFQVDATNLVVNATAAGGDAFINDANNVNIGPGASVVTGNYDLTAGGDITSSGALTANNAVLSAGNAFILGSTIIGNTSISLTSVASITDTNVAGATLTTPQLNLTSTGGSIGSSSVSRLNIDAVNLTAVANGGVFITDANNVNITGVNTAGGNFDVAAANNISTAAGSTITSTTGSVLLRGIAGTVTTAGTITANTAGQSVTLRAGQSILNGQVGGAFTTPTLNLISDNGNIGASTASRFNIGLGVANVTANAAAGSVFLTTAATVNLGGGASSALNTFDVLGTGGTTDITTSGPITAATIVITAGDDITANGSITATGNVTLTANDDIATNAAVSGNNVSYVATTGGVTLGGATTGTTSISITSNDSILNASITGGLTAPQINLTTNNDIGVNAGARLNLNAVNLTVNAGDDVFINDTAGGVNFTGANTADVFNIQANGDISNSGTINTGALTFAATGAGSDILVNNVINSTGALAFTANGAGGVIAIGANVTATGAITMSADGNLTTAPGVSVVNNNNISLNSNNGSIGTGTGSRFLLDAINTQVTAANGDVFIEDLDTMALDDLTANNTAGGTFDALANGDLTVNTGNDITATNVVLRAGGAAGILNLNASVTGTASVSLRAAGNIAAGDLGGAANVVAPQINLTSDTGSIGLTAGTRLQINATNLTANAANNVFINDTAGGINIGAASSAAGGTFDITTTGAGTDLSTSGSITALNINLSSQDDLTIGSALNATNNIVLTNNAGDDVVINGTLTAGNNITVTSDDNLNVNAAVVGGGTVAMTADNQLISSAAGTINGNIVNLTANGGTASVQLGGAVTGTTSITINSNDDILNASIVGGLTAPTITLISGDDIGNVADRLNITATNLSLQAADDIHVSATGSVNLLASSAGDIFNVLAANNLTSTGAITGDNVVLRAVAGSLGLGANVNGTTDVTLRSFNGLTNLNFTTITTGAGGTINLISDNGDIGTSPTSRLTLDADNLTANAANGSVYIFDTDSVNLGAGSSSAANNFNVSAAVNLTNSGTVSADNVTLRATAGSLTLNALVSGVTSVTLRSGLNITDAAVVSVVSDQINLISDNGNVGTLANPLNIDALNLTANAFNGDVYVNDANNVTIGNTTSSAFGTFSVVAGSNLSTTSTITAQNVILQATTGSLFINALITGGTSISLLQNLTITNANIGAPLVSPQINLTSFTGDIGTGTFNRLVLDAASISFTAGNGNVYFQDPNAVNISSVNAGGTVDLLANNNLSNSGAITATDIVLTSTVADVNIGAAVTASNTLLIDAGNNINLGASVSGGTSVTLDAGGTINQTAGTVGGGDLVLNFVTGPVTLATNVATLTTNAAGQTLTINENSGITLLNQNLANLTVTAAIGAPGDLVVQNALNLTSLNLTTGAGIGNIVLNASTTTTGDTNLLSSGTITQTAGTITADELGLLWVSGDVSLQTDVVDLSANGGGNSLSINDLGSINLLQILGMQDLIINANGSISTTSGVLFNISVLGDILFFANAGDVILNSNLAAVDDITLSASGTITQNAGQILSDDLALNWGTGNVTLATDVNSLSSNSSGNNLTINEASGIVLNSQNVTDLTINAGLASAGNIALGTALNIPGVLILDNNNGDIVLGANDVDALSATLNASGTISQAVTNNIDTGSLFLAFGAGPVTLNTVIDFLVTNAPGQTLVINQTGDIQLGFQDLNSLTVTAASDIETTVDFTVADLNLTATGGSILFNSNVNVTNVGNYVADDTISQGIGFILGGEGTANLTWVNGNVGLNTAIATLTADGGTNSLTITENTGLNIGALVLGSINVAAGIVTPGDINLNTANTVDTVTLTTDGDININANLISATSASFTASGDITQAGATTITTPNLTVGNTGLNTGTITILDTAGTGLGQSITVVGLSNASITTNELGFVALQASTANTLTIDASDSLLFSFAGDATVATTLSVTAPNVLNQNDVIATTINIQSAAGVDLNIDGGTGGTWTAFAGGTNFTAGLGADLTLFGTQDIFGVATFSVSPFQTITIDSGAVITGDSSVTLNTCNLNLNGILIGNPIIFNCPLGAGTIANSGGNVVLTSDLIFNGLDLAIIASGSIIESGITTIDLSNSGGDGGSLTLLAGFDFTPATVGTEGPGFPGGAILRTVTGTSLSGGSIQLGTTNITTAATGVLGAGGSVFAAASGGSVELASINTSSALGGAGNITVTGENGIVVNGNLTANAIAGGDLSLQVGTSVVNGQVLIGNGEMFGTGSIDFGTATAGSVSIAGNVNVGNGDVTLTGALTATDSISTLGNFIANSLTINAGVGDAIINSSDVSILNSNSNGLVQLTNNHVNLAINTVTGATQDLAINNFGNINFNATASINLLSLVQNDGGAFGISVNGAITTVAFMLIGNYGSNDLVVNAALSSGTDVNLLQVGIADILVNANLTTTGGGDIVLFAGDVISTLAGTTLNSSSDISIEAVNAVLVGANSTITSIGDTTFKSDNDDVTFGLNTFVSAGGAVNINADQDVVTGGDIISTTVTNITATNGEVILNGALSGLGDVNVTAATDLTFNSGINSIGTLGNVVISVGDQVVLNAGDTDVNGTDVTITATNGIVSSGAQGFTANATAVLDINAAITIGGVLQLTGDSVSVSGAINANAGVSIGSEVATFTTEANITSSLGDVFITANTIANTFAITGNNVTLQSFTDGGLVIDGTAGPGGTVTATTGVIDVIANGTTGNLTFLGEQDFIAATTNFTVPAFSSIIISAGADVTASNVLNLNTCNLVLQGSLAAPTINFNCPLGAGTIANSIGNVDLSGVGVLNFSGSDLAIIASGNVLANGNTSINLSSATEDGGNLLVVAGFDFLPATGGQVNFVPTLFTVTGTSATGGNIDLTGMTINTSSTFSNGGNVTLVANGGGLNDGTITTESINTSGVNFGGNVTIIGESDIALNGAVTTTGATGGDITIAVAQPILAPGPATLIGNGELLQGGFGVGAPTAGTLTALNLNAGNGDIALTVGNGLLDTTAITDMTADAVSFNVGDGSAFVSNSSVNELNISSYGTGNGFVGFVNNTGNLLLTANAPSNDLNASLFTSGTFTVGTGNHEYGSITIGGSTTTVDGNIDASSLVTVYGDDGVIVNGTIDSDSLVTLEILTAGNIDVNGAVTGANVRLTSLTATDNITVDAPITATNVGGEIRFTINGGTVNQTAALNSDIVNINGTSGQVFLTLATNTVDALNVNTNGSGSVAFTNSGNLALNVVANATQDLAVTASGTLDLQNAIVGDDVTLIGAGTGLNVDQTINATNVDLISNSGNLTIGATVTVTNDAFLNATGAAGDIVVNALVTGPTVTLTTAFGQGGDITLNTGVSGTTSLNLDSDGALTQTAGTITGGALSVTFETGATVLTTIVTSLTSTVNGTSLTVNEADAITLNANSGTNLTVNTTNGSITTTAPLSFANLNLNAGGAGSDLNLGADVTGSTTIVLTAVDTINPSIGTVINGGALTLNFGNVGPTVLGTNVASLTTNNAGGTLTVTNVGDITLLAQTLSSLTVSTLNGSISTGAGFTINDLNLDANSTGATAAVTLGNAITVNNALTVTAVDGVTISNTVTGNGATNISTATGNIAFIGGSLIGTGNKDLSVTGTGNIQLNFGPLVGSTVNLTTNNGNINQVATAVVQANILNLSVTGGIADLSQAQNEVAVLNASGTGAVFFNNGTTALSIGALGGTQSLTASTTGAGSIAFGAAITTTGNINLTTETLNNTGAFAINANDIDVQSNAGLGLVVNGGTGVNIATYGATNGVTFSATFDNLVMNGNTTFTTVADLSALSGTDTIIVSAGANVIGQQMLTVHTCNLQLVGTLMGNPLVYDNPCGNGTIANSNGDVNLLGDIIYNGNALAIIASGNINAGGATLIDLSNNAGNGGNLTLIAGYDFGPPTGGQVTNGNQTYTFTGFSATGGSINLGTVNIVTNGTGGNGGNVLAVAHTGSVLGSGAITLADVTSNGTIGGDVNVIAQGALTVQDINVTGVTAGGNVSLATAVPSTGVGNTVLNGVLTGTFTAGANNGQTIAFNSITSSGAGDVTLTGNLNSAAPGTATGDVVTLNSSDDIGVSAANRFAVNANTVTGSAVGDAFIRNLNAGAATLGTVTVATGGRLDAFFTGNLTSGAQTAGVIELRSDGTLGVTGALTGTTSIGLSAGATLTNAQVAAANLVTPLLTLRTSNNANIGVSGTEFQVGAGVGEIRIDTVTNGGDSAFVRSLATAGVNLGLSQTTNDLTFLSDGPLTVIDNVTALEGNINITGTSGTVRIDNGVTVQANSLASNGNVFIGNALTGGNKKTTFIQFGDGAQIIGNAAVKPGGNVTIQMGALTTKNNPLNQPKNVTFDILNGGAIQGGKSAKPFYAGKSGDPQNIVRADGAIVFISNTLKNKNIVLEGNVLIQADPPSVAGESAALAAFLPNGGSVEAATKSNGLTTSNLGGNADSAAAATMLNTMFNSGISGITANTAIGTDLTTTATTAGIGTNGAGSTVTAADNVKTLVGGVSAIGEDNSYMVGGYGPTAQAEASICSDIDLGVSNEGVARTAHSNRVVLKKGNVLFVPFQNTVVETPHGTVSIEAKSVALISISDDKLAVYDFEDSHKGSVTVDAHGQHIALAPGNHVTVAHEAAGEFAQVNAIEAIPHRNVATKTIKAGVKAHTSEFSVASAIQSVKPLQLVMSSKHPQAKQVANKMMKTTAILLHMGGNGGEFQHYFKPAMTAMAK